MSRGPRKKRPAPRPLSELPDPLTIAEVAEILRCSDDKARELTRTDGLIAVRLGQSDRAPYLIYKEDLLQYIAEKRGKAVEGKAGLTPAGRHTTDRTRCNT